MTVATETFQELLGMFGEDAEVYPATEPEADSDDFWHDSPETDESEAYTIRLIPDDLINDDESDESGMLQVGDSMVRTDSTEVGEGDGVRFGGVQYTVIAVQDLRLQGETYARILALQRH